MRDLKAFGLTLVAVIAMGAIAASAASANQLHYWPTAVAVASNATQNFQYETEGQTVQCTTISGSSQASALTASEVTVSPTYSGCKVPGIASSSAEVSMNGCNYVFTIEAAANSGAVHLKCLEGKQITITVKAFGVSICSFHIGDQTPSGVADYANGGTTKAKSTTGSYVGQVQVTGQITGQAIEIPIQVG